MLLECGHCGAPLDIQSGQQTYRCRYCGHASHINQTRQLMPQTPPTWRPPQRWRPPPHVPADSNVELQYRGSSSNAVAAVVTTSVLLAVGVAVGVGVFAGARRGGGGSANPFASFDPASLDAVKFNETVAQMQQKLGGSGDKYLNVPLSGSLFDYMIFTWNEKHPEHPYSFSMHRSQTGCTPAHEAARARLKKRLGKRFDGQNWRWGASYLSFDDKCSMVSFSTYLSGSEEPPDWKHSTEVMWNLVRTDVFGRPGKFADADVTGYLARGYDLDTVGKAIASTTIDTAMNLQTSLPGTTLHKSGSLDAEIPLDHPRFAMARVSWNNEKNGGIRSLDLSGYDNKLPDYVEVAKCIAPKAKAKLELKETDYMNKKMSAYFTSDSLRGSVSEYAVNVYSSGFGTLKPDAIQTLMTAAAACQ